MGVYSTCFGIDGATFNPLGSDKPLKDRLTDFTCELGNKLKLGGVTI